MKDEFIRSAKCAAAYIAVGGAFLFGLSEYVIRPVLERAWPTPSISLDKAYETYQQKNRVILSGRAGPTPNN